MSLTPILEMLQARIGLDPLSLGPSQLPRIIDAHMRALSLGDPSAYAARLASSPTEFEDLVEEAVVSETWFFRGGSVFSYLVDHIRKLLPSRTAERPFRILSVPCSTGEEPYSMVIALTEAEVPREHWTLNAVDLSTRHLERARQGLYRDFAFRDTPVAVRARYFRQVEGGWEINPALRDTVNFQQGNLIDPQFLGESEPFDLIFCRNLLIYLHAEARKQVLLTLDRLLSRGGLLCMGHAEPLSLLDVRFRATGPSACFLFQRKEEKNEERPLLVPQSLSQERVNAGARRIAPRKAAEPVSHSRPLSGTAKRVEKMQVDFLVQARRHADAGELGQALAGCQAQLEQAGPSADLFSLMGVIHQARREEAEAVACFRKALYLEPNHDEALLHLMLLYQQKGDEAGAALLRRRLERKTAGGEP
jgi:chemotaxis protein methyltransferase WspC